MPLDLDALEREVEEELKANPSLVSRRSETDDLWAKVMDIHPQSGGPFGGRDNALTKLVGLLRRRRIPYEAAREFAQNWNALHCLPPLLSGDVAEKVSHKWAEWAEGDDPDETPDTLRGDAKPKDIKFLTFAEMAEEVEKTGGQQWIVPNGLPVAGLVYITAPPAGGKTWVLLDLVRAAAAGGSWLGTFNVPQIPTLYIDEEMGAVKAYPRLVKLGMPQECKLLYTNKAGIRIDDPKQLQLIVQTVKENEIKLVIVDTMTRVHRYDENDNSQMRVLFSKFSEIMAAGACVVVAHHERKGGQGESSIGHERTRGASEISASADMCFSIEKRGGWHRMVSTKSRLVPEDDAIRADFVIEDSEDKNTTTLRPVDVEERSERYVSSLEEAVLDFVVEHGPCNMVAIRKGVKGDETAKGMALATLVEEGKLAKERDGKSVLYSVSKSP